MQFFILEQLLHHSAHNMDFCFLVPGICIALVLCIAVPRGSKNRFFNYACLTVISIIMNWFQAVQVSYLSCTWFMFSWIKMTFFYAHLIFFLGGRWAACSTIRCLWCDWFCYCSLFVEWRSKTGKFGKSSPCYCLYYRYACCQSPNNLWLLVAFYSDLS